MEAAQRGGGAGPVGDLVLYPAQFWGLGYLVEVEVEFFAQFAGEGCGDGFEVLDEAAGYGVLVAGGAAAVDQAELVAVEDDGAGPDGDGRGGHRVVMACARAAALLAASQPVVLPQSWYSPATGWMRTSWSRA